MATNLLYPSMMCVEPSLTREYCEIFEKNGIAGLHVDIMDGSFVPNFTLGTDYCRYLHEISDLPLDIHMMVERPEEKLGWFPIKNGDIVSIHAESTKHLDRAIQKVRELGGIPFTAINPATPLSAIEEILPSLGGVLVMTVNPGFAGQKLVEYTVSKVEKLKQQLIKLGLDDLPIEVDGNISPANLVRLKNVGANCFVIGTSGFLKKQPIEQMIEGIKEFSQL